MSDAAKRLRGSGMLGALSDGSVLDLTIFLSCYNEAEYIVETLDTIRAAAHEVGLSYEIVVIDDCSRDNSRQVVSDYISAHPDDNLILRANAKNRGLAQNYVDGAFFGIGQYYRLVCGDNCEPQGTLVRIFRAIGQADCIVPYPQDGSGRSWRRLALSRAYTFIINAITGYRIRYYNGLAVHHRHNVMRWHTNTRGFGFQAEILCLLLDHGFSYVEIPVRTIENRSGRSNAINLRNSLSVLHTIVEIANRRISSLVFRR